MPKTNNDLLIRIDERVKKTSEDILEIKHCLDNKVDDDIIYENRGKKIETLWDDRNKVLGWRLGAGVAGGSISSLLAGLVKTILANF